jgi:hypothetical protein
VPTLPESAEEEPASTPSSRRSSKPEVYNTDAGTGADKAAAGEDKKCIIS